MPDYTIGQVLYCVERNNDRTAYCVWVTKIGSKWISISRFGPQYQANNRRFAPQTGEVDGGKGMQPLGRIWPSKVDYEAHQARREIWQRLRAKMERVPEDCPTVDVIVVAARLLHITDL